MLSVLIAFVFSGVWSDYRTAGEAMGGERSALHGAAILAYDLPDHRGALIERAIAVYAHTVATDEWREMTHRKLGRKAQSAFEEIIRQAASDASTGSINPQVRAQILTLVMQAHDQREVRTYQLTQGVPPFIWATLIVLFVLQLTFLVFAGVEHPMNLIFAGAFAGCTVLVMVSISMLDFPFEGALALSNADFVQLSRQTDELFAGRTSIETAHYHADSLIVFASSTQVVADERHAAKIDAIVRGHSRNHRGLPRPAGFGWYIYERGSGAVAGIESRSQPSEQ